MYELKLVPFKMAQRQSDASLELLRVTYTTSAFV